MSLESVKNQMHSGVIYDPASADLADYQLACIQRVNEYNAIPASAEGVKLRAKKLKEMFEGIGEGCYIEPPFHANLGGTNVTFGSYVYANFNLTLVDDTKITVGDRTMIGPNVTIATACHPISPALREAGLQYNLPVKIGRNVWIGTGAIILPGVTVGDNSVIGAGSVVTKDVPSNVVAVGNPCRVLRPITEEDDEVYRRNVPIPKEVFDDFCK